NKNYILGEVSKDGFGGEIKIVAKDAEGTFNKKINVDSIELENSEFNVKDDVKLEDHLCMKDSLLEFSGGKKTTLEISEDGGKTTCFNNTQAYAIYIKGGVNKEYALDERADPDKHHYANVAISAYDFSTVRLKDVRTDVVINNKSSKPIKVEDAWFIGIYAHRVENGRNFFRFYGGDFAIYSCLFDASNLHIGPHQKLKLVTGEADDEQEVIFEKLWGSPEFEFEVNPSCVMPGAGEAMETLLSISGFVLDKDTGLPVSGTFSFEVIDLGTNESGCKVNDVGFSSGLIDYVVGAHAGESCVLVPNTKHKARITIKAGGKTDVFEITFVS
ncbi:MAG: hypothetical protein DRO04_01080, partial [Candidatus Iainarchaeum archaeon]